MNVWQLGQFFLMIVKFFSFSVSILYFVFELSLILSSLGMLQQFDLALMPLVIIQSFNFIVGFDSVPPDEQIHE